jgi:ABC-type glycerol-3-phosphate transport system permease component
MFLFFIGTMMIPGVVTLIPSFLLTRNFPFALPVAPMIPGTDTPFPVIRIWDTPWAVIIPGVFNAFNFLMFKGFFDTIPDSIIQAARVDGGSEFNIFRRIVLPMSVPVFAVAAWMLFGSVWESYLWPLITIQSPEKQPVTVVISGLVQEFNRSQATNADAAAGMANNPNLRKLLAAGLSWNGLMVLGLLQTIPVFIMFIICREYLMKGIRVRGFK